MALDGTGARSARTLTNREAAMLYGQGWECAENGAQIWHRLTINAVSPGELGGEEQTTARATRLLRRRRLEVQFGIEQLKNRIAHLRAFPLARFAARKTFEDLLAQLALHEQMLKELPQRPVIHRLDPEAGSGFPSNALKLGASIWFVNKKTQHLFSCEVTGVAIEKLDGPTLVYETAGAEQDGKPVRRTCAHLMDGLKTLGAPEMPFMNPLIARDYQKMIMPPPAVVAGVTAPVSRNVAPISAPKVVAPKFAAPKRPTDVLPDPDLHLEAVKPFDEWMLE